MMLSTHSNMADEVEEWNRLRFNACQTETHKEPDLSFTEEEVDSPENVCSEKNVVQKKRIFEKRVSFPSDETVLVQNLEPIAPEVPECIVSEDNGINLIATYTLSCMKNETKPVEHILEQLKTLDLSCPRSASLILRGHMLDSHDCESLEDILKNVPLKLLDLGDSHSSDDGLIALFDMIEFYEAATHVSIAANKSMTTRGWQACCRMIKRTECLEWLDAAQVALSEHSSTLLARALRSNSRLRVLYLNDCELAGRSLSVIASSIKMNRNLRELHLAENKLTPFDALQLGILLSGNSSLQLLDLRNNEISDKGMGYLCDALLDNTGLISLVVWNNGITQESSQALVKVLASNHTLQTLNLGHNKLGDEGVIGLIPGGLERNRSLLHLGLQENGLTCTGIISLAESLASGTQLKRVDLRKNPIALAGLMALAAAVKHSLTITKLDLDIDISTSTDQHSVEYQRLIDEIATCCISHNMANENDTVSSLPSDLKRSTKAASTAVDDVISRKISLTCPVPPSEKMLLPLAQTDEKNDQQQPRVPRKLRSPLPSPSPSPSPSPLPSPSGRFKVTRVETDKSPLPSPRSRFTVTPVAAPAETEQCPVQTSETIVHTPIVVASDSDSQGASPDYASLIRSSPSKVVIGFDVLTT